MLIAVRPMRPDEARLFLEIQGRSVRGLAAPYYPRDVIDAWAVPPTDTTVSRFLENADGEIRLVAELEGELVGLGVIVVANSELRACYVVPEAARKGVGTALVREIERIAQEHGLDRLELLASLNAEPFYAALGYESGERTEHVLRNRQPMAAVRMTKNGLTGHGAAQTDGR